MSVVYNQDLNKIVEFAEAKVGFGVNEISRMDIHQLLKKHVETYSAWLKDVLGKDGYRRVGKQIVFDARLVAQLAA